MDDLDRAQVERERLEALAFAQQKAKPLIEVKATGCCLNCGKVQPRGYGQLRWCDVDCRNDWEKRNGKT